jgi:hypothetical protein
MPTHAAELRTAATRTSDTALAALLAVLADAAEHPSDAAVGLMGTVLHPALAVARQIRDTTQETRMPDTAPGTELRRTLGRVTDLHELDGGACGTCADADGQAAVWPCETAQQLQVAEQLLRAVEQPAPARQVLGTTDQQQTTADAEDTARRFARRLHAVEQLCAGRPGYHTITVKTLLTAMGEADEAQPTTDQPTETEAADPVNILGVATGGACGECCVARVRGRTPEHAHCRAALDQPDTETEAAK